MTITDQTLKFIFFIKLSNAVVHGELEILFQNKITFMQPDRNIGKFIFEIASISLLKRWLRSWFQNTTFVAYKINDDARAVYGIIL